MQELKDTIENGETEVLVVPKGEFFGSDSEGNAVPETIDDEVIAGLESKLDGKELLVDKDHSSMKVGQDRDTSAMGWMHSFKKKADGLWAKISWTDIGKKLIENRVFRFLSPSFILKDTKPTEMLNVGLTNQPAFKEAAAPIINHTPTEDFEQEKKEDILTMNKEELMKLIDEAVAAAVEKMKASNEEVIDEVKEEVKEEVVEAVEEGKTPEETKEEVKEEVVDNGCSEDKTEEVANEEPEKVEETKAEEVVEKTEEVKEEEKKEDKDDGKEEVIKLEALNAAPKTEGIDVVKHSAPKATDWRNLHGKAFIDWMNGGMK